MKKAIIFGFFVGMSILTYLTAQATAFLLADDVTIRYDVSDRHLSDTEADMRNIKQKGGHHIVEKINLKYTFTKKNFGWDIKVDTVGIGTYYHEKQ